MMYMFVSPKLVENIKKKYNVDLTDRPDVLLTEPIKDEPVYPWECRDCGKGTKKIKRCECGGYVYDRIN